jgi:hypothetical protein
LERKTLGSGFQSAFSDLEDLRDAAGADAEAVADMDAGAELDAGTFPAGVVEVVGLAKAGGRQRWKQDALASALLQHDPKRAGI